MKPKIIPQEESIKTPFWLTLFLLLVSSVLLALFWTKLPPKVPLFYSRAWGEPQLAPTIQLGLPIVISFFILVANSLLAQRVEKSFLSKILIFTSLGAGILAAITTLRIILLIS